MHRLAKLAFLSSAFAICASQAQASPVVFSSADATFYQTYGWNLPPSQMIDGDSLTVAGRYTHPARVRKANLRCSRLQALSAQLIIS